MITTNGVHLLQGPRAILTEVLRKSAKHFGTWPERVKISEYLLAGRKPLRVIRRKYVKSLELEEGFSKQ